MILQVTALQLAAEFSTPSVVKAIAQNCADVVDVDADQCTQLHKAALHNHVDIVKLLIEHGANVNSVDNQLRLGWMFLRKCLRLPAHPKCIKFYIAMLTSWKVHRCIQKGVT